MKHLFIINPAAGSHNQAESYSRQIAQVCEARGLDYTVQVSGAPGQCCAIARQAAESGQSYRIYACGGDGTLNEVVNGAAGHPNVSVTAFACGSGNDFVRMFGDGDAFRDMERLLDAEEAEFDLICCNGDYCLNICSVGFDARIGTDVGKYKRLPLVSGFRAYALSAVINTIKGVSEHYTVEIDGETVDGKQTLICVCNGQYYGGGFNPVPDADPTDGLLDVLLIKSVSRLKVAQVIGKYKNGQYAQFPNLIRHIRTRQLKIHCDGPTPINLDGELRVSDTVDISLAPVKLKFFYPRGLSWAREPAPAR